LLCLRRRRNDCSRPAGWAGAATLCSRLRRQLHARQVEGLAQLGPRPGCLLQRRCVAGQAALVEQRERIELCDASKHEGRPVWEASCSASVLRP
jgi:hypothetical protein